MNNGKWLLSILSFALLANCAPKPPDVPVCEKLTQRLAKDPETDHLILRPSPTCMKKIGEAECGHCTYIVSGKEIFVGEDKKYHLNGKPWSQITRESIVVPAVESYAPLAEYVINACKKMKCDKDVERFKLKVDSLNGINDALNPLTFSP